MGLFDNLSGLGKQVSTFLGWKELTAETYEQMQGRRSDNDLRRCLRFSAISSAAEFSETRSEDRQICQRMLSDFKETELPGLESNITNKLLSGRGVNFYQALEVLSILAKNGAFDGRELGRSLGTMIPAFAAVCERLKDHLHDVRGVLKPFTALIERAQKTTLAGKEITAEFAYNPPPDGIDRYVSVSHSNLSEEVLKESIFGNGFHGWSALGGTFYSLDPKNWKFAISYYNSYSDGSTPGFAIILDLPQIANQATKLLRYETLLTMFDVIELISTPLPEADPMVRRAKNLVNPRFIVGAFRQADWLWFPNPSFNKD